MGNRHPNRREVVIANKMTLRVGEKPAPDRIPISDVEHLKARSADFSRCRSANPEAQLPELILAVDVEVRFSWMMLGSEPHSSHELLMVYARILAHGTALSAAETVTRMTSTFRAWARARTALRSARSSLAPKAASFQTPTTL
jgi:hypothetical protein